MLGGPVTSPRWVRSELGHFVAADKLTCLHVFAVPPEEDPEWAVAGHVGDSAHTISVHKTKAAAVRALEELVQATGGTTGPVKVPALGPVRSRPAAKR